MASLREVRARECRDARSFLETCEFSWPIPGTHISVCRGVNSAYGLPDLSLAVWRWQHAVMPSEST